MEVPFEQAVLQAKNQLNAKVFRCSDVSQALKMEKLMKIY
jgi:hypothetical protein